jgi:hypothetical protein
MGEGVVELVLQLGDSGLGPLGVEVWFQDFVEGVEFASLRQSAVCSRPTSQLIDAAPKRVVVDVCRERDIGDPDRVGRGMIVLSTSLWWEWLWECVIGLSSAGRRVQPRNRWLRR